MGCPIHGPTEMPCAACEERLAARSDSWVKDKVKELTPIIEQIAAEEEKHAEWEEKLMKHDTLHTGNCYCEEDIGCNYQERLLSFIRKAISAAEERGFQAGKDAAVEYVKDKFLLSLRDLWGSPTEVVAEGIAQLLEEARTLPITEEKV